MSANAATEFCPANVTHLESTSPDREATTYHYQLQALAPRVVDGTFIADTDAGWFTWVQQAVQLTRTTYMSASWSLKYWFHVAESPELTVVFPQAVAIRHFWVATARSQGDRFFDWDSRGVVTCEPPDFAKSKHPENVKVTRSPQAGDETPAPAPPPANAVVGVAPFPPPSCVQPFISATVTDAVQPDFPAILVDQGLSGVAISIIAIALDEHGKLVDAWVWASSGCPPMDDAALKAARRSKYTGATSYCLPVSATYLFRADFEPR
ncbi:MAG TPA: energy transducer TonB [Candidatus Binatia bacterium]|nr:energy transducer TonB [Candidatus Binatia bacterium]